MNWVRIRRKVWAKVTAQNQPAKYPRVNTLKTTKEVKSVLMDLNMKLIY
jgi:hypothetical protein